MIAIELLLTDEVHGNVVFVKVVWLPAMLLGYLGGSRPLPKQPNTHAYAFRA